MADIRKVALDALIEYERSGTFGNLALKKHLRNISPDNDKRFITALFYGVVENKILLDYYISKVSSVKLRKINIVVLNILRMGLYQIIFMNTPQSAACNTSVELAKNNGQYKSSGFVNAILRKLSQIHQEIDLPPDNSVKGLSVKYSVSEKIITKLLADFDVDVLKNLLEQGRNACDGIFVAVNLKKIKPQDLVDRLEKQNVFATKTEFHGLLEIKGGVNIESNPAFAEGLYHVIGFPSYISALTVCKLKKTTIVDMCAAPGGKTFVISYNSDDDDEIYAFDLHEHKINNLNKDCKRLGISNVYPCVSDGTVINEAYIEKADTILCDVPCSGLGMIFKKPDIKYKDIDFDSIADTQFRILSNAAQYLKKGGRLVYSTCTITHDENRGVIDRFLKLNPEFYIDDNVEIFKGKKGEIQFMSSKQFSDGFYIAVLARK